MGPQRSYGEEVRLFRSRAALAAFVVLLAGLIAFPFLMLAAPGGSYYVNAANLIAIYAIVAVGLNILVGCAGQISLGHAGFFAIGAYVQALLVTRGDVPVLPALAIAGLIAAAFGLLLGLPALRLSGPYLAIATLGFGMAVCQIVGRLGFLGGRMGFEVPAPGLSDWLGRWIARRYSPGPAVDAPQYAIYLLAIPLCVLLTIAAVNLMKSRVGRAFAAMRDSEVAAETMGINLLLHKAAAFGVSAFYTGIAGGLYAHHLGFINPESFDLRLSIMFLTMVVLGGLSSILGSHLGALLITLLTLSLTAVRHVPEMVFGVIMILVILFEPQGLHGCWLKLKSYWKPRSR